MNILVIDVGGTNIKVGISGRSRRVKIPSGPRMTPARAVAAVAEAARGWRYDVVSVGYPGPVRDSKPSRDPKNLGAGWVGFDFAKAFGKPVRCVNDAAMQALGSYRGGRMLFLGLGTGLGSALVASGTVEPLELAHLPYRKNGTYEDYLGARGLKRLGPNKWQRHVERVVELLRHGMQADYVTVGGGNAKKLRRTPPGARIVDNKRAIAGGAMLWRLRPTNHGVGRDHSRIRVRSRAPRPAAAA
jgi:predicted NBD/HSP70 family sugar kinase